MFFPSRRAANLLLTAAQSTVKLVDLGLAREETLTEMMTAKTGTYRWMAPEVSTAFICVSFWILNFLGYYLLIYPGISQLYSTVTLRHGEKKHYNHKVDVYSFAIVLWELLHNKLPFEGMSNLQAAYAAAFKVTPDTLIMSQLSWRIVEIIPGLCLLWYVYIYTYLAWCFKYVPSHELYFILTPLHVFCIWPDESLIFCRISDQVLITCLSCQKS